MTVIPSRRTREHAPTDPLTIDDDVLRCIRYYGPRTGVQLEAAVRCTRSELVERLAMLVACDIVRHDGRAFSLRGLR